MNIKNNIAEIKEKIINCLLENEFEIINRDGEKVRFLVMGYKMLWRYRESSDETSVCLSEDIGSIRLSSNQEGLDKITFNIMVKTGTLHLALKMPTSPKPENADKRKSITITGINDIKLVCKHDLSEQSFIDFDFVKNDGTFRGTVISSFVPMDVNNEIKPDIITFSVYNQEGSKVSDSYEFIGGTKETEQILKNYCI